MSVLYYYRYDDSNNIVRVEVLEVEERPKTYKLLTPSELCYRSVIQKTEIDVFATRYGLRMVTLKPAPETFIERVKEYYQTRLFNYESMATLARDQLKELEHYQVQEVGVDNG